MHVHLQKKHKANNINTKNTSSIKDGSSIANAVVIDERSETAGVSKEYQWLREKYPGYTFKGQSLNTTNAKPYDIINIKQQMEKRKKYTSIFQILWQILMHA